MEAIGVIPARYGSTRFEGKVIKDLCGKPVIQHVYERAKKAKLLDDLIIATDDDRILKVVEGFGGKAVFTSKAHLTGTDRLTEVVNALDVRIVVNIQGDEPLINPLVIDDLVRAMQDDPEVMMATVVKRSRSEEEFRSPDVVKAVMDSRNYALYFSRSPIPTFAKPGVEEGYFYKHIGIYAYHKDFLFTFKKQPPGGLETLERLEQLRALENGTRIKCIETKFETVGVDTPEDLALAKAYLEKEQNA
ncbi:MAG TPA: 3-deoxy-manno-octulosonate cytidylyltransferase [Candidatus Eisenbacteria bacterium]|jgi:3-deoxy-manno-octulosonate cytidylyltransferase (CMP-KDO synthetase)|nr:3-deoxy-manno-octulosonate cytidylyltransferase [Candidatus Eisenbacteria bacterium]